MRPKNVRLGLLVVALIVPLISCGAERERLPTEPASTTPVRAATATPQIIAPVTSDPDPLSGTRWELMSIESEESAPSVPEHPRFTLTFSKGMLGFRGECVSVSGHYVLDGERITITFTEIVGVDCADRYPGIDQVAEALAYAMPTFESYAIEDDRLAIRYAEGEILLRRASKDMPTLTPTAAPTWTTAPTGSLRPTQTPTVLPTATQTATPFPKVELPIGALAFISYDRQLLVRDPAGEICVLAGDGIANSPAWSLHGTRLAFSYQADDRAAAELRTYDLRTGDQSTVWTDPDPGTPRASPLSDTAWSPSGRFLAFSQGCCLLSPLYLWDLAANAMAGKHGAFGRGIWSPREDVLAISQPQPIEGFVPVESGDSSNIALLRPGDVGSTVLLTGTAKTLYYARAWPSEDEILYQQLDLTDEGKTAEWSWGTVRIVDGEAVDNRQLDAPPLRYDNDPLQEHLSPWLPAVTVGDYDWSADGTWVVFSASWDTEDPWRVYAFHWEDKQLVGPLAEAIELALAPVRTTWRCPE